MPGLAPELAELGRCVRQGDWHGAAALADLMNESRSSLDPSTLESYRHNLQDLLVAARVARANLAITRARLHAAAIFAGNRQEFGE